MNFEANLEIQPNFNEKKLEESNFKEEIKSLYQTYFEKYKFVVTPNLKSFNSLFKLNKNNYYGCTTKNSSSLPRAANADKSFFCARLTFEDAVITAREAVAELPAMTR